MKTMQSIKEFKEKNDEACLTAGQAQTVFGGATSNAEEFSTNEASGFGHTSDQEVWTYDDNRQPMYASIRYFDEDGIHTYPIGDFR